MSIKCVVDITVPGTNLNEKEHPLLLSFIQALKEHGVDGVFVDQILGWGCLDQNWFEFEANVETDFGWCKIDCFTDEEWYGDVASPYLKTGWHHYFSTGQLLMMLYYIKEGKEKNEFIPHH